MKVTKTFPTTRKAGFAFFLDLARWPEWTPFLVDGEEEARLAEKGDEVGVVYRLLGVPVPGTVTLEEVVDGELIAATLRFPGLPAITETFELHGTGTHAFVLEASLTWADGSRLSRTLPWVAMLPLRIRRDLRASLDKAHAIFAAGVLERAAKKAA